MIFIIIPFFSEFSFCLSFNFQRCFFFWFECLSSLFMFLSFVLFSGVLSSLEWWFFFSLYTSFCTRKKENQKQELNIFSKLSYWITNVRIILFFFSFLLVFFQYFRRCLELDPTNSAPISDFASFLYELNRFQEGLDLLLKCTRLQ